MHKRKLRAHYITTVYCLVKYLYGIVVLVVLQYLVQLMCHACVGVAVNFGGGGGGCNPRNPPSPPRSIPVMCRGTNQKALSCHAYVDMDECSSADLNFCTQLCNNTEGSYLCHCTTGYFLDPTDGITCHGNLNATTLSCIPNCYCN